MKSWRWYWKILGGHVHIRVFVGEGRETTHAKCGDLVMSVDDFRDFNRRTNHIIDFLEEPN